MTRPRAAVLPLSIVLLSLSAGGLGRAAEPAGPSAASASGGPGQSAVGAPSASAASPAPPPAVLAGEASAGTTPPVASTFIEELPPSAYPAPHTRGIYGGSLWSTFHGLQWPYYPKTGIGISGSAWVDTGYEHIEYTNPAESGRSFKYMLQQGRFLLRITPTYTHGDYFVQAQAEFVANKNQGGFQAAPSDQDKVVDADDVWVRAGRWNQWDVQVGRFEGWEIYHFGMGLDINTLERFGAYDQNGGNVPAIYGVTFAMYRPSRAGQLAAHFYPTNFLRFELGSRVGNDDPGFNYLAVRPVAVLDVGILKVKVGAEYLHGVGQVDDALDKTNNRGAGGSVQLVLDPHIELGLNGARGLVDRWRADGTRDEQGSYTVTSVGAFANGRIVGDLIVGAGLNYTILDDLHLDSTTHDTGHFNHVQGFGAIQYILWKQLFIKAVVAYAKAVQRPAELIDPPNFTNTMMSGRLRLMYLF